MKKGVTPVRLVRYILLPFGYLAFVVALVALSGAARLLGEEHELGFFSGRLAKTIWRYPEVTRRGVQVAWIVWATLLVVSLSPIDPLTSTYWDAAAFAAIALLVLSHRLHRLAAVRRSER